MADFRIVDSGVQDALDAISNSAKAYESAGGDFIREFNSAIDAMEGEIKDALKGFIDGKVNTFVVTDIPAAITGLHTLLTLNRDNIVKSDLDMATNIATS